MTSNTYADSATTPDPKTESGSGGNRDVIEVVEAIFHERGQESPFAAASDEADDLVAALEASERLGRGNEAISLEESMRAHGVDPAEFGLSGS